MITRGAPASTWAAALSRSVKMPVDSITTSTPRSPHGSAFGPRSAKTFKLSSPAVMPSPVAFTSTGSTPWVLSYLRRGARDRKCVGEGKSVSERVDLGGRGIINTKDTTEETLLQYV